MEPRQVPRLHEFQKWAVDSVVQQQHTEIMSLITAPCGAGKTIIAVSLVLRYLRENSNHRVCIVLPNRSILGQFRAYLHGVSCHVFDPNQEATGVEAQVWLYTKFMLTSANDDIDTVKDRLAHTRFGLVVFDEVHELLSPQRKWLFQHFLDTESHRVGLTATWPGDRLPVQVHEIKVEEILRLDPPRIMLPTFQFVPLVHQQHDGIGVLKSHVPTDEPCILYVPYVRADTAAAIQKVKEIEKLIACNSIHGDMDGGYDEVLSAWVALCEHFPWGEDSIWTDRSWWQLMTDLRTLRYLQTKLTSTGLPLEVRHAWSTTLEEAPGSYAIGPFHDRVHPGDVIISQTVIYVVTGVCVNPRYVCACVHEGDDLAPQRVGLDHVAQDDASGPAITMYKVLRRPRSSKSLPPTPVVRSDVSIVPPNCTGRTLRWKKEKMLVDTAPFPATRFYAGDLLAGVFMPFYMKKEGEAELPRKETIWIGDARFPSSGAGHQRQHTPVFHDNNSESSNGVVSSADLSGRVYRVGLPDHMVTFLLKLPPPPRRSDMDRGGTHLEAPFRELYWLWADFVLSDQQMIFLLQVLRQKLPPHTGNMHKFRLAELRRLGFLNESNYCDPVRFIDWTTHWISRLLDQCAFPPDIREAMGEWRARLTACLSGVNRYSFVPRNWDKQLAGLSASLSSAAAALGETFHEPPDHMHLHMCATPDILSTGLNIPQLRRIIMVDPADSHVRFVQMCGRVMRKPDENKPTPVVTIVDTSGDAGKYEKLLGYFKKSVSNQTNLAQVLTPPRRERRRKKRKRKRRNM